MPDNLLKHEVLQKLATYDTPTICNVIEVFEVRPRNVGYLNGNIRAAFPEMPPMIGFAATASFRATEPSSGGNVYEIIEAQLEQISQLPGPAVVVIQDSFKISTIRPWEPHSAK